MVVFFMAFLVGLGWVFGEVMDPGFGYGGMLVAFAISLGMALFSYFSGGSAVLMMSGAREVKHEDNPDLYHIVENLCIGAGIKKVPTIYIIDDTAPNAFATGRDPDHAVVAVTSGLLSKLEKAELEGVIAHELSHIKNYDMLIMTMVVILVGVVTLLSDFMLRYFWWGGGGKRDKNEGGGQLQLIMIVVAIALAILSPLIATLIKLAISRKREYLADADAVLITRYPEGLARALEKLTADTEPLEVANKATAHLYIVNPLTEHKGSSIGWFSSLFNTHPPIEDRVAKLRAM